MKADLDITIHLANSNDVDDLTELHCASFRPENSFITTLGKDFVKSTYRWQLNCKDTYVLVAKINGKIGGMIGVCDGPYSLKLLKGCFLHLIVSLIKNPSLMFSRTAWSRIFRRSSHRNDLSRRLSNATSVAQIVNASVDSNFRGKGIFRMLADSAKATSRRRGSRAIRAGVYKKNLAGCHAYIKSGWIPVPILETSDTVCYFAFLDPGFPKELGIEH